MSRQRRPGRLAATFACLATAAVVVGGVVLAAAPLDRSAASRATEPVRAVEPPVPSDPPARQRAPFDRTAHSTTDPRSIWVIVNKTHPVTPSDFRPEVTLVRGYQVAAAAAGPLGRLLEASDRRGLGFKIASAFRSYGYQYGVHAATEAARGAAGADLVSARAGYSEHQTGLAVDLVTPADPACDFDACFARTPGGRWLARNAWRFGFVVRYQPATTAITGYSPEPWHLRYVGRPLAREMRVTGIATLEQFFDVRGGDYTTP